jgi:uncharacterized lipoprotein NlpE involved in copper resistance
MKKFIFISVIVLLAAGFFACETREKTAGAAIDAAHSSRNSIDWQGLYTGIIPAASSPGIRVSLAIGLDGTYELSYQYIDRGSEVFTETGNFKWNDAGSTIILDSPDMPPYYQVGENTLTLLDLSGNVITGSLADNYILRKE